MNYLLFMLFPLFIYGQQNYPDTLVMKKGTSFPCLITSLDNSSVKIIYANNMRETAVLESVSKIILEKHAVIYTSEQGMIVDLNTIQNFLEQRNEAAEKQKAAIEKELNEKLKEYQSTQDNSMPGNKNQPGIGAFPKWSFGALYIPYYSGKVYEVVRSSNDSYLPSVIRSSNNETNMEGQFSYGLTPNLRFTFDLGYSGGFTENRDETHVRYSDPNQSGNNDYGSLESTDLKLFTFNIGFKYYFTNFINEKVSAYVIGGFGKQLAFTSTKDENLFPNPNSDYKSEDNMEEYLKDLNSPWQFNIGFGAEYFFNESLSLFSNIRIYYSRVNAKYEYRTISSYQTQSSSQEYTNSDILTRIGLGLNFYF